MVYIALLVALASVLILARVIEALPGWFERARNPQHPAAVRRQRAVAPNRLSPLGTGLSSSLFGATLFDSRSADDDRSLFNDPSPFSDHTASTAHGGLFDNGIGGSDAWHRTNPATGLPMMGGVDVGGNPYGISDSTSLFSDSSMSSGSLFDDRW